MRQAVVFALLLAGCATSTPAPITYGPSHHRTVSRAQPTPTYTPRPPPAQPNWAEGEGTPLSAYALQPDTSYDPRNPPRTHRVAAHESLANIAAHYQVPVMTLIEQNHMEPPYRLAPGSTIELPPPNLHTVARGETFVSIADRYNVQPHSLAILNRMSEPAEVREGDVIVLPATAAAWTNVPPPPPPARSTQRGAASVQVPTTPTAPAGDAHFAWPVRGDILARFGAQSDGRRLDGVEIAADQGEPVKAAADGEVVYAGSDLPSYGTLILIRHADSYVTAYGYAQEARVREGQQVHAGDVIAQVGRVGAGPTKLMFQVRQGRNAVDPLPLLHGE